MKPRVKEEYLHMDSIAWKPFPEPFSQGGIRWKLLHVSPEVGAWTAIFDCPAGSSFAPHIHNGPGEYFLTRGKLDVRGGKAGGGDTVIARGYGYESANARHDKTAGDAIWAANCGKAMHWLPWRRRFSIGSGDWDHVNEQGCCLR